MNVRALLRSSTVALAVWTSAAFAQSATRPPAPPVKPVTEDYFGTEVTDPYRYMENMKDPQVLAWVKGQGAYTRAVMDSIPKRAAFLLKVSAFSGAFDLVDSYESFGGRQFYEERVPGSDNFDLMVRAGDGATHKLVDVAALRGANGGRPYAINYYAASPDGRRIAVGISQGGSEDSSLFVYDVATGKQIGSALDRANQAAPAWTDDGNTLFFLRLPPMAADASRRDMYLNGSVYAWNLVDAPVPLFGPAVPSAPKIPPS